MPKISAKNSEHELLAALKRGEESAYTEVLNLHKQQIAKTVIGMLGAVPEAEDVGQEVFIRFFKSIENFKGDSKIATYLTRIAINLSLNALEKRKRKWKVFYDGDYLSEKLKASSNDPHELDERLELLTRATLKLESKYREVVVLRASQDYSFKEIAEIIQVPIGTVLTRYSRAQKKLIKMLNS